ncbi:MAG: DUF4136 domain-containing protein [Cyclobacteriaceae bacterium]
MKHLLFALVILISLPGAAQKVTSDLDKSADFTQYKTYKFLGWQDDSDKLINQLDQQRIYDAFENELSARGLEFDQSSSDLAISLFLVTEDKTSTTAYTDFYGGRYGTYRRGGWGWGTGFATTTYSENDYVQGTLVVDIYDESSQNLIWQGVVSGAVNENPQKREKSIPKTIRKLMKKYPVQPAK